MILKTVSLSNRFAGFERVYTYLNVYEKEKTDKQKKKTVNQRFFPQNRPFWEIFFWILLKMGNWKNTSSHFLGKSGKSGKSTNQEKFQKRGSKLAGTLACCKKFRIF